MIIEWRRIPATKQMPYLANYDCSDTGRVRRSTSAPRVQGTYPGRELRILVKRCKSGKSPCYRYLAVNISVPGTHKVKVVRISHLVLMTFSGPRPSFRHVACHMDDNQFNNHINNIMWRTQRYNVRTNRRCRHSTRFRKYTNHATATSTSTSC